MKRIYWPTTEWQTANPAELKMDIEKLSKLDPIIKAEYGNIGGIVIVRNGYIAYENYYNGYGPDDTLHVASVTKSVLSAIVGIAIDKGFIKSTDQKVLDFFPEYIPNTDEKKKQEITIKNLLTMTAPYTYEREPFQELCCSPDWAKFALDLLGGKGEIGEFKYSTAGAHLLSTIITRSTGKSAREFANEYLFRPIGMKELPVYNMTASEYLKFLRGKHVTGWVIDPTGNSTGGWGLTLTPRDMARFGFLYLNQGSWDNQQIISPKWIDETIAMNPNHYGYLWWLFNENDVFSYSALGDGGNAICCIPEKDIVVAIASKFLMNPNNRLTLIKEYIIPAVVN
jgi:CubicO group peptidase (beta-lactamase class C family)